MIFETSYSVINTYQLCRAKLSLDIREEHSFTLLKNVMLEMLFIFSLINNATLVNVSVAENK